MFPAPRAGGLPSPSFPIGLDGVEPRPGAPNQAAPQPVRRDPRSRTAFLLNPNQADYRLPRSRQWTTGDLNPAPPACDAGALPDELAAQGRRGAWPRRRSGRHGEPAGGAHAMDESMDKHVHPKVVLAGTERFELPARSFGGCCSAAELRPYRNGNRPSGLSLGRLPACAFCGVTRQPS